MSYEPTNGELDRRLDTIQGLVQGLIGRQEYLADQRATDRRMADVEADVKGLDSKFAEALREVHARVDRTDRELSARIDAQAAQAGMQRRHWQELIFIGVLPAVAVVLVYLLGVWTKGSGH